MIFLPGYKIRKAIYHGAKNTYYTGERKRDGKSVVIKIPLPSFIREKWLMQLSHEHEILSHVDIGGIPKSYGIKRYQGGFALILEVFSGLCLAHWHNIKSLHLQDVLIIGSKMAEILGGLHGSNVIHQGIKREAIFYEPEAGDVWLTDFTSASFPSQFAYKLLPQNMADEMLPYLSPEQTGRTNRTVDYRTDFYSLGVTLYEIATGSLPFTGADPLEIVHSHLARQPLPPREVNALIPEIVSAILIKLLAKSPEDRYQSAWGLKADFDECLSQLAAKGEITPFPTQHGHGLAGMLMRPGVGYFIELPGDKSIYISGDTVMTQTVKHVLNDLRPDISILNAGTAILDFGRPILMPLNELLDFTRTAPGKVIAVHLDAFNHCLTTRAMLRDAVTKEGLSGKVIIPADGELMEF